MGGCGSKQDDSEQLSRKHSMKPDKVVKVPPPPPRKPVTSNLDPELQHLASDDKMGEYLKKVPLFAKLSREERAVLGGQLSACSFAQGNDIITQGDKGQKFFILKKGIAVVIRVDTESGSETQVAELGDGDYFGEAALLNDNPRGASIRAKKDCECLSLDRDLFNKLFGKMKLNIKFAKRNAVTAGPLKEIASHEAAEQQKSEDDARMITEAVKRNVLFSNLDDQQMTKIVAAMWKKDVKSGEQIIKQGEAGDFFYVVESGSFDIFLRDDAMPDPGKKVNHAAAGATFGELALMYNAPRAATVVATEDAVVWAVDRYTFRKNLIQVSEMKIDEYEGFLREVPLLSALIRGERIKVAEALEEVSYADAMAIVKQGEMGDSFYIIKRGTVAIDIDGKRISALKKGEFFGERSLIKNEPRAATCTADGEVELLTLNRSAFELLLGPLNEQMHDIDWDKKESRGEEQKPREQVLREDLEVVGVLGRGSFGLVQLMKHKKTGKNYALKQVAKSQVVELGQQEHILSEKNVMAQCDHPFIIRLVATYKDKDFLYFLIEVCMGGELFTLLRSRTIFNESQAKFYTACVVLAFEYLHERNIVYRDLKPENLLIDDDGYLKIVDFGFAKVVNDRTYTLCGTPDYLAPEVIVGQGHGKGVDWWTIGVLLFEMLASYPPFYDEDPMRTYARIMHGSIDFPRHFSPESIDLLQKLLHPKATKRYGVLKGGASLIKQHPWFKDFDWEGLYKKTIPAPYVPDTLDLTNFPDNGDDEEFDFPPYEDDGTQWDQDF